MDLVGCDDLMGVGARLPRRQGQAEAVPRGRTNVGLGQEWTKLVSMGLPSKSLGLKVPSTESLRAAPSPSTPSPGRPAVVRLEARQVLRLGCLASSITEKPRSRDPAARTGSLGGAGSGVGHTRWELRQLGQELQGTCLQVGTV